MESFFVKKIEDDDYWSINDKFNLTGYPGLQGQGWQSDDDAEKGADNNELFVQFVYGIVPNKARPEQPAAVAGAGVGATRLEPPSATSSPAPAPAPPPWAASAAGAATASTNAAAGFDFDVRATGGNVVSVQHVAGASWGVILGAARGAGLNDATGYRRRGVAAARESQPASALRRRGKRPDRDERPCCRRCRSSSFFVFVIVFSSRSCSRRSTRGQGSGTATRPAQRDPRPFA